ncbi:MAG: superoxide dismutase family protein [Burkholderiales bacterium]
MKAIFVAASCALWLAACATAPEQPGPSAVAKLDAKSGSRVRGEIKFTQVGSRVRIEGVIAGLAPGERALHIHERGDCSAADATSAGGHFDPREQKNWSSRHGGPHTADRHAGDLGNIVFDRDGKAVVSVTVGGIAVDRGPIGIIGRAAVVHFLPDDLKSDPTGDAGARAACGVIR